jgi:hypothetical protein
MPNGAVTTLTSTFVVDAAGSSSTAAATTSESVGQLQTGSYAPNMQIPILEVVIGAAIGFAGFLA